MKRQRAAIVALTLSLLGALACQARTSRTIAYVDCIHADTLEHARDGRSGDADSALAAQQLGAVAIVIPDAGDGRSRAGALIGLHRDSTQRSRVAAWGHTDSLGALTLAPVPSGLYHLSVWQIGYNAVQRRVMVRAGHVDTVHFRARLAACRRTSRNLGDGSP